MMTRILLAGLISLILIGLSSCKSPSDKNIDVSQNQVLTGTNEARLLAEQIYAYGYPLVIMDVTKDMMTHSAYPTDNAAPTNQFVHKKTFPDYSFTDVVTPNADTLYSSAWLDLTKEPIVLSLPDTGNRYYLMQMMSAWTEVFANPGSRTTGNRKIDFVITGPRWTGTVPAGARQIKSPTNDVWIIGRTQTNGTNDYAVVQELQKKYKLTPLSAWGTNYKPPSTSAVKAGVNLSQIPVDQVESLSGVDFFVKMSESMKRNPPLVQDGFMIEKMKRIGLIPGQSFDPANLSPDQRASLNEGARIALSKIINAAKNPKVEKVDGWVYNFNTGRYGTNYRNRAAIAMTALGANLPQDAVYPRTQVDTLGRKLNGKNRYIIHFAKHQLPPVNAFWSITMYNNKNFFEKNPIDRYALGDRSKLIYNSDGSLDIYVQYQAPDKRRLSNWLPSPRGDFNMVARLYWPKREVLTRKWHMPGVQRLEEIKQLSQNGNLD
ncbi:DUF1254 domain-containing protein [Bdellovibrio svalbardensis]|uniref:DUF1254 domain-containing protein n=1 Tax=Bdellovibrio svalbardensis TaxID=2972972 RepID=A0ABT6DD72_9BACT|nr:DUF1254 domain-containing protein [Bdellovibrio svalbardensis]MDG0814795.1 DUF1254 domain-containing protein [Bdellovibrio svalbardensis]